MGILVVTGIERALADALSILSGLVLAVAYTAPIKDKFAL
jgi:hypothetical protein